jgi:hypothetical protein
MKPLFYLLLLANLTLFLWEQFVRLEPAGTESGGRMERQLDSIVLLKELPPAPVIVTKETIAAAEEAAPNAVEAPPVEAPPVQAETPTSAETPVQIETPSAQQEPSPPAASMPERRNFCARLGPFTAETEAKEVRRGIHGVSDARVESRTKSVESGYWVLHPPASTLEEAKANKRTLMARGASETLILREGENANAVSLGYFLDRTRAETLLRDYRAKGFDTLEIRARHDGKTEYWLNVRSRAEAAQWQGSLERLKRQQPNLRAEEKARCGENGAG